MFFSSATFFRISRKCACRFPIPSTENGASSRGAFGSIRLATGRFTRLPRLNVCVRRWRSPFGNYPFNPRRDGRSFLLTSPSSWRWMAFCRVNIPVSLPTCFRGCQPTSKVRWTPSSRGGPTLPRRVLRRGRGGMRASFISGSSTGTVRTSNLPTRSYTWRNARGQGCYPTIP